jgi:hypothetical protein
MDMGREEIKTRGMFYIVGISRKFNCKQRRIPVFGEIRSFLGYVAEPSLVSPDN